MTTVTEAEASRSSSALVDQVRQGEVVKIVRGGEHVATMVPPHRANGAAIIAAYTSRRPDPATADTWQEAHDHANALEG